MASSILNEKEKELSNALVEAVNRTIDEIFIHYGYDHNEWTKDPVMLDDIMDILAKVQNIPFRIAFCRHYPDQFGKW